MALFEKAYRRIARQDIQISYNAIKCQGSPSGYAVVCVHRIGQNTRISRVMEAKGASIDDKVASILYFFPNSIALGSALPFMRRGRGTALLDQIINDVTLLGAKAIYGATSEQSMMSFLEKKGFCEFPESYSPAEKAYYKLISPENL